MKRICLFLFLSTLIPFSAQAHNILFYYNGSDPLGNSLLKCVTVLQNAGNSVMPIDVQGVNRDPTPDFWGAPYDQVWDARFTNVQPGGCGTGSVTSPDYFDARWQTKAITYLNHCGKLFLLGENHGFAHRDEGLYSFLQRVAAVKKGYSSCPPSVAGNSSTQNPAYFAVSPALGPVSFFGNYIGGIPLAFLNGTSYVHTAADWAGNDWVDRAVVAGWTVSQLGGWVNVPVCQRGKLFMVWDMSMWESWAHEQDYRAAKVTDDFFPAVAAWLGNSPCSCATPTVTQDPEATGSAETPLSRASPLYQQAPPGLAAAPPAAAAAPAATGVEATYDQPETVIFNQLPANIDVSFADGPGHYQLKLLDEHGNIMRILYDANVTGQKDAWVEWDGKDKRGYDVPVGQYSVVFSKDGRVFKKIVLGWVESGKATP